MTQQPVLQKRAASIAKVVSSAPEKQRLQNWVSEQRATAEGGLIAVTPEGVVGWGRDLHTPARSIAVVLMVNDKVVNAGVAERFDIDLVRTRIGTGIPGFIIDLPPQPSVEFPLRLTLCDRKGQLLGAPLVVTSESSVTHSVESVEMEYEGMVDCLRDGVLVGWARSVIEADRPVIVELFDGRERIGRQVAQKHRVDLMVAGKNQGNCAFSFELPISMLDGREHSLRVVIAGTSVELQNSPIQFGHVITSAIFEELVCLRQETERLRDLINTIVAPNGMLQSQIIQTMSERMAALLEIQRDSVERELDALRKLSFRHARADVSQPRTDAPPGKPVISPESVAPSGRSPARTLHPRNL